MARANDCPDRLAQLAEIKQPALPTANHAALQIAASLPDDVESNPFAMLMTVSIPTRAKLPSWVVDSGATYSATFDESECVNIQRCNIQVIAAGHRFSVKKKGTAVVHTIDQLGNKVCLTLSNCLISPLFPYRLLSVNAFTRKGHTVTFAQDQARITNHVNNAVLIADRDPASQLLLLRRAAALSDQFWPNQPIASAATAAHQVASSAILRALQTAAAATKRSRQNAHLSPNKRSRRDQTAKKAKLPCAANQMKKAKLPCTANLRRQPCFQLCADPTERTCCPPGTCSRAGCI